MRPLLRRIAIHGALTAALLGVVGVVFAEVASIWLASSGTPRASGGPTVLPDNSNDAVVASLRSRVPLFMAVWGFGFVAVGELALHLWRSRKPAAPPCPPQPDEAEKLLEELLAQAEARRAEDGGQRTEDRNQEPARPT
jgi:hypothetical protein